MQNGKLLILRFCEKLMTLHVQDKRILSLQVYETNSESLVGNIYIGKVQNITKGVDAAFVEIAKGFTCFLPLSEIKNPVMVKGTFSGTLKAGDELLVQIEKDAVKTKQPVLTTKLSLSGKYLAISIGKDTLGLSGKLNEDTKQEVIRYLQTETLIDANKKCLFHNPDTSITSHAVSKVLPSFGCIVRTNVSSLKDYAPLKEEWIHLSHLLSGICTDGLHRTCYSCLYHREQAFLSDLKNFYTSDYGEIVTDCPDIYEQLQNHFQNTSGLRFYQDTYPLEKLYSVKTQLENALQSRVWLKSGGYLIIEPTEALTVIDVNTGKYEARNKDHETASYLTNLEAADEIALQLRLRNISGIIIVDFINMKEAVHCQELLTRLQTLLRKDSVPSKVVDMTPLGLVEITRKRVSKPLRELLSNTSCKSTTHNKVGE